MTGDAGTAPRPRRVLVVDDESTNLLLLQHALRKSGYEVDTARSAFEAKEVLARALPDIILLDISMPEVSGLDLLRELRQTTATMTIPVMLVSALTDTDTIVEGLQWGANDYITKPVDVNVLLARVRTQLQTADRAKLLEAQAGTLAKLALTDALTGLVNRRGFSDVYAEEFARALRYGRPLVLAMLDLDHFKVINDLHGHSGGDAVLQAFAQTARGTLRSHDLLCRYGGEEFCAIMPETSVSVAATVAERVRSATEAMIVRHEGARVIVTVSIGLAGLEPGMDVTPQELIEQADKAMYQAKAGGRNRVVLFKSDTRAIP